MQIFGRRCYDAAIPCGGSRYLTPQSSRECRCPFAARGRTARDAPGDDPPRPSTLRIVVLGKLGPSFSATARAPATLRAPMHFHFGRSPKRASLRCRRRRLWRCGGARSQGTREALPIVMGGAFPIRDKIRRAAPKTAFPAKECARIGTSTDASAVRRSRGTVASFCHVSRRAGDAYLVRRQLFDGRSEVRSSCERHDILVRFHPGCR